MNTVIAPYTFTAPSYSQTITSDIARGQSKHYFFRVPREHAGAEGRHGRRRHRCQCGSDPLPALAPFGLAIDSNAASNCYNPDVGGRLHDGQPDEPERDEPQAGAEVTSTRTGAPTRIRRGAVHADRVDPRGERLAQPRHHRLGDDRHARQPELHADEPARRSPVVLSAGRWGARGSRLRRSRISRSRSSRDRAGATSLRATIGSPSDPGADLDLVYNCTSGRVLAGQNADGDSEESVTIGSPAAGAWKVVVDGFAVPAGTTTYKYIDVFFTTSPLGTIRSRTPTRPAGRFDLDGSGTVTANAAPGSGRVLYGNVQVRTDTNVLVGSGDVIVQNVN